MEIKPKEIKTLKYWIHIAFIAILVLGLLQLFKGGQMLTVSNILWSIPLLGIADIIAHTILKLQ